MPNTFRAIELGLPLDRSVLPASAVVEEITGGGNPPYIRVREDHQDFFPVGFRRYEFRISRNEDGDVTRVFYKRYAISYWVLFLHCSSVRRERFIGDAGKQQERLIKGRKPGLRWPLPNFGVFLMGVRQCFP